jgi:DNA-binding Lrp family transcriptional regulator
VREDGSVEGGRRVDEGDVALIDALHVSPRASFAELGAALGVSAVTVGRRWQRLAAAGEAWVSSAPGPSMPLAGALVEVACVPGRVEEVARALAVHPQVFSVHLTSGAVDLYALVLAADGAALASLLVDRVSGEVGAGGAMRRVDTGVMTAMFSGAHWRLGAISASAEAELSAKDVGGERASRGLTGFDRALFLALQLDGRSTFRELSSRLERSEPAIRRRLDYLVRSGLLTFRTDFARLEGGWPVHVALSLRVPDELLVEVGSRMGAWSETRVCVALVAAANLFVTVQLHELGALDRLLRRIRATWSGVEIVDRRVVLRSVKSWGRVLDTTGRAVETVPVDIWA